MRLIVNVLGYQLLDLWLEQDMCSAVEDDEHPTMQCPMCDSLIYVATHSDTDDPDVPSEPDPPSPTGP